MKEINITKIEPVTGAIYKGVTYRGRAFVLDVTYTLADGRTCPSHVSAERKKDVLPRLERERIAATAGAMKATFDDVTGAFMGTSTRYTIGAGGMVPLVDEPEPQQEAA